MVPARLAYIAISLVAGFACNATEPVVHPSEENIILPSDNRGNLSAKRESPEVGSLDQSSPIKLSPVTASLGHLKTPPERVFGRLADVEISTNLSRLFVLDQSYATIRVFSLDDGSLVTSFGGPGLGPNEFKEPRDMALLGDSLLYVGDATRAIKVFPLTRDSIKEIDFSFRTIVDVVDMCISGDALFIHGLSSSTPGLIHEYSLNGSYQQSFGRIYSTGSDLVGLYFRMGRMACGNSGELYFASPFIPVVVRFSNNNGNSWYVTVEREDFRGRKVVEGNGGIDELWPENSDYYEQIESLSYASSGYLIVQVGKKWKGDVTGRADDLITYYYNLRSGRTGTFEPKLPVIHTFSDGFVGASAESPYPRVEIFRDQEWNQIRTQKENQL